MSCFCLIFLEEKTSKHFICLFYFFEMPKMFLVSKSLVNDVTQFRSFVKSFVYVCIVNLSSIFGHSTKYWINLLNCAIYEGTRQFNPIFYNFLAWLKRTNELWFVCFGYSNVSYIQLWKNNEILSKSNTRYCLPKSFGS